MRTIRVPSPPIATCHDASAKGPLDGELLDLYAAILIVVPLAPVPEVAVVLSTSILPR